MRKQEAMLELKVWWNHCYARDSKRTR